MKKKTGRPPVLDATKKREILAILAVGCSRRVAAAYVACDSKTIRNTARRDPEFARELGRAENQSEIGYLRSIQKAAKKEQYWRAAAWVLERRNPQDYALRRPEVVTVEQIQSLLAEVAQTILAQVTDPQAQQQVLARIKALTAQLSQIALPEAAHDT